MDAASYTFRTRPRVNELEVSGRVAPGHVLEWMQEAASEASSAAGYPFERYAKMGAAWIIKSIDLHMERSIPRDAEVEVTTWVASLHRFRSRRGYHVAADRETVARAQVEWLLLEVDPVRSRFRPRLPDEEMRASFPILDRDPLAGVVFEAEDLEHPSFFEPEVRQVRASELDPHGHVNHVQYLVWFEDYLVDRFGQDAGALESVRLSFLRDAKLGDRVQISASRSGRAVELRASREGEILAVAHSLRG